MRPAPSRLTLTALLLVVHDSLTGFAQATQPNPIIVQIVEPDTEIEGLADVLIGALGLTGLMVLGAVLAAGVFAGVLFWIRSRTDS